MLEDAARATGDDCFGLHFGERYNPKNVVPLTYVVLNSPTIAVGLENAGRYLRVHNEAAAVSFAIEGRWAYARHLLTHLALDASRQHNEYSMAVGVNLIRLMAGSQWAPAEVQFAHKPPLETSEHVRIFGAALRPAAPPMPWSSSVSRRPAGPAADGGDTRFSDDISTRS